MRDETGVEPEENVAGEVWGGGGERLGKSGPEPADSVPVLSEFSKMSCQACKVLTSGEDFEMTHATYGCCYGIRYRRQRARSLFILPQHRSPDYLPVQIEDVLLPENVLIRSSNLKSVYLVLVVLSWVLVIVGGTTSEESRSSTEGRPASIIRSQAITGAELDHCIGAVAIAIALPGDRIGAELTLSSVQCGVKPSTTTRVLGSGQL
ncbi:hypothetical protein ElyMa_005936500 [Elysia marginata]|uniref:Uncharacterized protein n=1 Tax=Elysia marginata TaxID=1093978 RepID=A0AAV4G8K8_9GAST|nr:hypothetical protein ElyMa_005936500 [Elysia marginata]